MKKNLIIIITFSMFIAVIAAVYASSNPVEKSVAASNDTTAEVVKQVTTKVEAVEVQESPSLLVYAALFIMAVATLLSIAISFYLYRWRRVLLTQPNLLVPEEWGKYLDTVGKNVEKLGSSFTKNINHIATKTSESSDKITNMTETYMSLHNALDEKDSEIRRLKKGYDAEVFRKFLSRFIRIDQSIDDYIYSGKCNLNNLDQLKRLLEDALDECGVERFAPQVGEDYRRAFGVADNPKTIKTVSPEEEFMVAEVLEAGYRLRNGNDCEVITPSKVKIYRYGE